MPKYPPRQVTGPPRQATGPPRSGAGEGGQYVEGYWGGRYLIFLDLEIHQDSIIFCDHNERAPEQGLRSLFDDV